MPKTFTKDNSKNGFTIVELLVVIVVIGVLAAISFISYSGIAARAQIAILQSDLKNAYTSLENSKTIDANEKYPIDLTAANLKSSNGTTYAYSYRSSKNTYCLSATNAVNVRYYISSSNSMPQIGDCPYNTFAVAVGGAGSENLRNYNSITQASDGGYVVVGQTDGSFKGGGDADIIISRYTSEGSLAWTKTWGNTLSDQATSVIETIDKGFMIVGNTGSPSSDILLLKLDSNGNFSWAKTWALAGSEYGNDVIQNSDGSYVVTGEGVNGGSYYGALLIKFDVNGNFIWNNMLNMTNISLSSFNLIRTNDDGYAIAGRQSSGGIGATDAFMAKFAGDGALSWRRSFGGGSNDGGFSLVQNSDGDYYITGYTYSFGTAGELALVKMSSTGSLLWSRTWGGTGAEGGYSIGKTSDGNYIITGVTASSGAGGDDIVLIKYDPSGNVLWQKTFGSSSAEKGFAVSQTDDDGYIVVSEGVGFGVGGDIYLLKYNNNGEMSGCLASNCKTPNGSILSPSLSIITPSISTLSPIATVASVTGTTTLQSAVSTIIVANP